MRHLNRLLIILFSTLFLSSSVCALAQTPSSYINVKTVRATGAGLKDDSIAIQSALDRSANVVIPAGRYKIRQRLNVWRDDAVIKLDPNVTLMVGGWRYKGTQLPFGNSIHITGKNVKIVGSGATSIILNEGSDANGIGYLHTSGGYVGNLVLDGGKTKMRAIVDDTFQSGISVVNASPTNKSNLLSNLVIEKVIVKNWAQYGINIYGDLARGISIRNSKILSNGIAHDRLSVGAGIVVTRGPGKVRIEGNTITGNKGSGIFQSSAGLDSDDFTVSGNNIADNGGDGIQFTEEAHYGATTTSRTYNVAIFGNKLLRNRTNGIRVGTFDNVGRISNVMIENNVVDNNGAYGVLIQSNKNARNGASDVRVKNNNIRANAQHGVGLGPDVKSVAIGVNVIEKNKAGAISR